MSEPRREELKARVRSHWEGEVCYTRYGASASRRQYFDEIEQARYTWESYIPEFAGFAEAKDRRVLEIGVGAGTDFRNWITRGARASGIDLTEAAVSLTRENLELHEIPAGTYDLRVADAENLPFPDQEFDRVYSYGVLHHSPDTERAFREVRRVLKPGGIFKAMVYHVPSWTGWMLWTQHCLLRGRPDRSAQWAIYRHLESPGTKAYTLAEAQALLARVGFERIRLELKLGPGDLLYTKPSKKYQGPIFRALWKVYPRRLVARLGSRFGLNLLLTAFKPGEAKGGS